VSDPHVVELFERHVDEESLLLVSLMDHTPGQRQWHDLERYRTFHQGRGGASAAEFDAMVRKRIDEQERYAEAHRAAIVALARARGLKLASHDDTTADHVAGARAEGCAISEFPTTRTAADAARAAGMAIVLGAPNLVLGGSHSGNVAAAELAGAGLLDGLSSDYVPVSSMHGAFRLHDRLGWALERAFDAVSGAPARLVGLADRGRLAPGLRADLVRVRRAGEVPSVLGVWREGRRVA
jgi:alpha-D-ribose 1-methylphosphonate 5-triphosphate diphosphatase